MRSVLGSLFGLVFCVRTVYHHWWLRTQYGDGDETDVEEEGYKDGVVVESQLLAGYPPRAEPHPYCEEA